MSPRGTYVVSANEPGFSACKTSVLLPELALWPLDTFLKSGTEIFF